MNSADEPESGNQLSGFYPETGMDPSAIQSDSKMPDWLCRAAILMLFGIEFAGL
jgi:hypothetical protein